MRILAIMGSPRRNGTGTKVLKEIEDELLKRGPVDMDVLCLRDLNLGMCRGCFQCISKGEGRCPVRDELVPVEERIEAADGIILISPGYVQDVSALMKNFMDRMAYTNHRPRFFGKKVMVVANGGAGLDRTLGTLRMAIGGPEVVSELAYLQLPWPMREKAILKRQHRLRKAASRFHEALLAKDMSPSFSNYMRFLFFKGASEEAKEWLPADHEFYSGLGDYYYEVRISSFMRVKAGLLLPIGRLLMRDMAPEDG